VGCGRRVAGSSPAMPMNNSTPGGLAEWPIAVALKATEPVMAPGVQIPHPLRSSSNLEMWQSGLSRTLGKRVWE
jgi:hypothetical protein